jgi:transcriptional regulator with PAS, ATPase and Fis domain
MELAGPGTLFLDEIGDMPTALQAKLLRVLQEHQYERLGESTSRPFAARVVAATNVDIDEALESGQLRQDLYYRLRVVPIHIPPLRERREDVELLAHVLLDRVGRKTGRSLRLSPEALRELVAYDWPGNVRELENKLEYATALCQGQTISVEHLPELHAAAAPQHALVESDEDDAVERERIRKALDEHHWRRADAARALNISRTTLWRRMQALGIE